MANFLTFVATCLFLITSIVAQDQNTNSFNTNFMDYDYRCPKYWIKYQQSCYRFVKSPIKRKDDAKLLCESFQSHLVAISNVEEHTFLVNELSRQDPQHRRWHTSGRLSGGSWVNEVDGSTLSYLENAFLPEPNDGIFRDQLAYAFRDSLKRWGLEKVLASEELLYICEAPVSDLINFIEDDRDYRYGVEIEDPRRIPRGPYFTRQPEDKVYDVSEQKLYNAVVLSCHAEGYPTPTYQWYKEDYRDSHLVSIEIDPLTNNRYTISGGNLIIHKPEQTQDRGYYYCKATNEFGTILSESVELSFGYILEFNVNRGEERGDQNWGKSVYCDPPQHFPGVKYYWARDYFPNFVEEDKRVFVSNDGALYFSALEPIDRGSYSCNVQSIASNTGRNGPFFPLRVDPHSSFQQLKFPNNFPKIFPETPIAGEEVRLECIAFGYPVPNYNWTRKGAPLPRHAKFSSYNRILTLPNVTVEDQGEYTCRAFNERASTENSVYLSIQAEPHFTIELEDKHMDHDGDLTWTCEAFGIPDVTYRWYKNGEPISMDTLPLEDRNRFFIRDNILKIQHLDRERDDGMYQCQARNELKTKYSSAQLRVLSLKPSFKKHPMEPETYAAERGNVTIVCNPEAAPRPKFVWKKDWNVIGSGGPRRILDNGNLIIYPVTRDDEGLYICTATNQYGSDETRGRLIVLRGPYLIESLPNLIRTSVMSNQTLRCQADGDSMLDMAYVWTHNGIEIREKDLQNNPRWQIHDGVFDIINVTLSDAGTYECILKSSVGQVVSNTTVIVHGPPGPPGGVQVVVSKQSVTLQWTDGAYNGMRIDRYAVSARTTWSDKWFNISTDIIAREVDLYTGRKEAYLENVLNPFTTYEFRVSAGNIYGYGPPSMPSPKHSTSPAKPTRAPSNVGGGGGKLSELTITWDPLPPEHQNGRGIHYKIYWRLKGEQEWQSLVLGEYGNIGKYIVTISRDLFYMQYEVQVQAINEAGIGPLSEIATIYSAEDMPLVQPQRVSALSFNSTSLNVSWHPVEETRIKVRGKLIGYRIKYWPQKNQEEEAVYYLSRTTRPWSLIVGLQPNVYYYVKVMAYNSAGAGPESERFLEKTYRKAPQNPPSSVQVYEVNPSTVRVVWRYVQPSLDEEPLDGYKVRVWEKEQDMVTANDTLISGGSKLEAFVTNLSPGKSYNLRVLAYSKGGDGRMSSPPLQFQMGDPAMFRSSASNKILDATLGISILLVLKQLNIL
ncbi:contactin [Chelonus insularis]|uniref:contactin n=1 Tax=Chelonus insularis TaxID=460826 RepID=UPI001588AED7|nr:contactin [Chelonus insularis]